MKSFLILSIALAGISTLFVGVNSLVTLPPVLANLNSATNISCRNDGFDRCLWMLHNRNSSNRFNLIHFEYPSANDQYVSRYKVHKNHLKGECILEILNVTKDEVGIWRCSLIQETPGDDSPSLYGETELLIKGTSPKLIRKFINFDEGNPTTFTDGQPETFECSYEGPTAAFKWFLGNKQITTGLTTVNTTYINGTHYSYQELRDHRFSWRDNGKQLKCDTYPVAFNYNDGKGASWRINVKFAPKALYDGNFIVPAEIGESATFVLNFACNPGPTNARWHIADELIGNGKEIMTYKAVCSAVDDHAAIFSIESVAEEDFKKEFVLIVTNMVGSEEFRFKLVRRVTEKPSKISESDPVVTDYGIIGLFKILCIPVIFFGFGPLGSICMDSS